MPRYFLQFADRTSKNINLSEEDAQRLLGAWAQGKPVVVAGVGYANHFISVIKPMKQWAEEERERARQEGRKVCAYGLQHERLSDCLCAGSGRPLIEELQAILPPPRPPELPQTPQEIERAAAWAKQRSLFIEKRSMPVAEACKKCSGKGSYWFEETWIQCECVQ